MKLKAIAVAVSIASIAGVAVASSQAESAKQLSQSLQQISQEMHTLQGQVKSLRGQVATLKAKLRKQKTAKVSSGRYTPSQASETGTAQPLTQAKTKHNVARNPFGAVSKNQKLFNVAHNFGISVVLAPSTGVPSHYDGSDFIINAPSVNVNRYVMKRTAKQLAYYKKRYGETPALPALVLSGDILGVTQYTRNYQHKSQSDIDLANADLMAQAVVTPWVNGVMELSYDDTAAKGNVNRVSNSRFFLKQGFINIGNLNKAPVFGSIGQFYVPFGRYSSIMITDPLTKYLGRTRARALEVAYAPLNPSNNGYFEAFAYRGAASTSANTRINNGGVDGGFDLAYKKFSFNLGASFVRNLADADAMQDTGAPSGFAGFNETPGAERLSHVVPGGDVHAHISLANFTLIGEYVTALRSFSAQNLLFNGRGARPSAYTFEGDYSFNMWRMPSTFGLSYGRSYQSLGFNLPQQRFMAALQFAVQRFTLLTLEYRHDINYGSTTRATHTETGGAVIPAFTAADLGRSSNAVTAQLAVYF